MSGKAGKARNTLPLNTALLCHQKGKGDAPGRYVGCLRLSAATAESAKTGVWVCVFRRPATEPGEVLLEIMISASWPSGGAA
jgi:hypothetical protein